MDDEWARDFLLRAQVGHIATRWDEQPIPSSHLFWYDPERHEIYFHSNIAGGYGRHRAPPAGLFRSIWAGKLLSSNAALEFTVQYQSVIASGAYASWKTQRRRQALYGLIRKYFPEMTPGEDYRPITDGELGRTSVTFSASRAGAASATGRKKQSRLSGRRELGCGGAGERVESARGVGE